MVKKIKLLFLLLFVWMIPYMPVKAMVNFESTTGEYTIENILSKVNVFSFQNVTGVHIVGPVIGQEELYKNDSKEGFTFGDYNAHTSSYIKGKIARGSRTSSTYDQSNPTQYVGKINQVEKMIYWQDDFVYQVNGSNYVNNRVEVIQNDDYVNWEKAKRMLNEQSIKLLEKESRKVTSADILTKNGVEYIVVKEGETVELNDAVIKKIQRIEYVGDFNKTTLIHIPTHSDVILPGVITSHSFGEFGSSMNLIFNLPNTKKVTLPNAYGNGIGHLVAVNAVVVHRSGNYNGGIIANDLDSTSEGHFWPYTNGEIVAPERKIEVQGEKKWVDQDNRYGLRPLNVQVDLYADGEKIDTQIMSEQTNWRYSFKNLSSKKEYEVKEQEVENYTTSYAHHQIINTLNTGSMTITKELWINSKEIKNQDIFYITLFKDGKQFGHVLELTPFQPLTLDDLPLGTYQVKETDAHGNEEIHSNYQISIDSEIVEIRKEEKMNVRIINSFNSHIHVSKKDENGNFVKGANLQILDMDEHVQVEWISGDTSYEIKGILMPNTSYILREVKAPMGYEKRDDQKMRIELTSEIQYFELMNKKIAEPIKPIDPEVPINPIVPIPEEKPQNPINETPNTNDDVPLFLYIGVGGVAGGILIFLRKKMLNAS